MHSFLLETRNFDEGPAEVFAKPPKYGVKFSQSATQLLPHLEFRLDSCRPSRKQVYLTREFNHSESLQISWLNRCASVFLSCAYRHRAWFNSIDREGIPEATPLPKHQNKRSDSVLKYPEV
jgi:hypothetical protein